MKEKVGGLKRDLYKWFGKSVYNYNLISIYMECVMQEVDFCLSLGRVRMV